MGGDDVGAAWPLCCHLSDYLQSWGDGETLTALCLVAAREYRAARELAERSWTATVGVLCGCHAAMLPTATLSGTTAAAPPPAPTRKQHNRDSNQTAAARDKHAPREARTPDLEVNGLTL